ncbi:MAG: DUF560 domain-containing protein [Elusimicrobia bacterium]|nr:DUF560 domain-containing protein [Elusimicrobiota bacterium]
MKSAARVECALALLLASAGAAAQTGVRAEKPLIQPTSPILSAPSETDWSVAAGVTVARDNDINRLLTNSVVSSNARVPDTIVHSALDLSATPRWGDALRVDADYSFDRYDFQSHTAFSYYENSLSLDAYPRVKGRWSLDLGGGLDWVGDSGGAVSNSRTGRLGVLWEGPGRLRAKGGVEYANDSVPVDAQRDDVSRAVYLSLMRPLPRGQYGFFGYRFSSLSAAGPNYSRREHSLYAGLIQHWSERLGATWLVSYTARSYANEDTRFLTKRRDDVYTFVFKPSVKLWSGVRLVGKTLFQRADSNVSTKGYDDQVYSLGVEAFYD